MRLRQRPGFLQFAGAHLFTSLVAFNAGVEAGLLLMNERMQTGRFKVFAHLTEWFGEFRLYHRQDGKVVKKRDDLMSATRYGVMSLRHARRAPTETRLPARAAPWDPYDR